MVTCGGTAVRYSAGQVSIGLFPPIDGKDGLTNRKRLVKNAKNVTPAWVSRVSSVSIEMIEMIDNEIYK
jgi:hypothetical protein